LDSQGGDPTVEHKYEFRFPLFRNGEGEFFLPKLTPFLRTLFAILPLKTLHQYPFTFIQMKKLLLSVLAGLLTASVFGQIKITNADLPLAPGTRFSFRIADIRDISLDQLPTPGNDKTYDFSRIPLLSNTYRGDTLIAPPANDDFKNATAASRFDFPFLPFINQKGYFMYRLDETGWFSLGNINEKQSGKLPTGGAGDSLVIPASTSTYGNATGYQRIALPMEMGKKSSQTVTYRSNGKLYLPLLGYNGNKVTNEDVIAAKDSIVGWGKAILPGGSQWEVLHRIRWEEQTTNYYINDELVPDILLSQFGLTNGAKSAMVRNDLFAKGFAAPILTWYSRPVVDTLISIQFNAKAIVTSRAHASQNVNAVIYPNPVNNQSVQVVFNEPNTRPATFRLVNALGQEVLNTTIPTGTEVLNVSIPDSVVNGVYFVRIADEGQLHSTERLVIQR
jgi:hypothetical protein